MNIWSCRIAQNMIEKIWKILPWSIGQNFSNFLIHIWGNVATSYIYSEIFWPLSRPLKNEGSIWPMWKLAHSKVVLNIWIIFYTHPEKSMNYVTLTGHINAITNSLVLKWKCTVRSCRWWNKPTFLKVHFCKEGISLTFYIFLHFKTDHKRAFNSQ